MTAMNLIVQPKAGSAYLLTDTACYRPDGTINEFRPKVLTVCISGRASVAIAVTGMGGSLRFFAPRLTGLEFRCLEDCLAAIPSVFREVEKDLIAIGTPEKNGFSQLSAVVAHFDHATGKAGGHAISNSNDLFPRGVYRPYTLHPTLRYLTSFVGRPFAYDTDLSDYRQWKPEADAEALFEAQRADLFGLLGREFVGVGGKAIITKISTAGIEHRLVKEWPDRLGQRIAA